MGSLEISVSSSLPVLQIHVKTMGNVLQWVSPSMCVNVKGSLQATLVKENLAPLVLHLPVEMVDHARMCLRLTIYASVYLATVALIVKQ